MKSMSLFLTVCFMLCATLAGYSQNNNFPYSKLSFSEVDISSAGVMRLAGILKQQPDLIMTNGRFSRGENSLKGSKISNMLTRGVREEKVKNALSEPFSLLAERLLEENARKRSRKLVFGEMQNYRFNEYLPPPTQKSRKSVMYLEGSAEWIEMQASGWSPNGGKQKPTLTSSIGDWKFKVGAW